MLTRVRILGQQVDHGWNQNSVSYAGACDDFTETLRAEFRNRELAGPENGSCKHGGEIGDMKNRGRMKVDSAFGVSHPVIQIVNVCHDIRVSYHDALWLASRATG